MKDTDPTFLLAALIGFSCGIIVTLAAVVLGPGPGVCP